MRCFQVTAKDGDAVLATRLAPTNAVAKTTREELMATFQVKKKDVSIDQHEVPVSKPQLIEYINSLLRRSDKAEE